MKNLLNKGILVGAAMTASAFAVSGAVYAAHEPAPMVSKYTAQLNELNGSGATGTAYVSVTGNQATVNIESTGTSPGLPHAQHFHIGPKATSCPDISSDMDGDGLISTAEGLPSYGPIKVSLTTEGDVSADSGLAVERFPVGESNGDLSYSRTFTLPEGVTGADLANAEIVQHGVSTLFGDPGAYDGEPRSSIAPTLPLEATIPANCGVLVPVAQEDKATPEAGAGIDNATAVFANKINSLVNELRARTASPAEADAFRASYEAASVQFNSRINAAAQGFNQSNDKLNVHVAKDRYINEYSDARAEYFNQLDAAKNELAASLSNQGHEANVAKDQFMNGFNSSRDMYGNKLEEAKNNFASKVNNS